MPDNLDTRTHNIEILQLLGFSQYRNTTVFQNGGNFILSPAVAENQNGSYWFDIREVNLNRINTKALLLVRIVPDIFILETMSNISSLLTRKLMDNRPNSGNVWGIHIEFNRVENIAHLFNIQNQVNKISTKLLSKDEVLSRVIDVNEQSI